MSIRRNDKNLSIMISISIKIDVIEVTCISVTSLDDDAFTLANAFITTNNASIVIDNAFTTIDDTSIVVNNAFIAIDNAFIKNDVNLVSMRDIDNARSSDSTTKNNENDASIAIAITSLQKIKKSFFYIKSSRYFF